MVQDSDAEQLIADPTVPPNTEEVAERLNLYRYLNADNAGEYLQLMRLFTETLLTDLSASEAHEALVRAVPDLTLTVDDIENRCRQLVLWGNLVPSVRDARVATVSEWLRSRSRYQVSKLGGRVHRQVDEVVRASEGAREVARELLGGTVQTLQRILGHLDVRPVDADALAGDVTTVFNNQRLFAESATDFYAFVQSRVSRYDLGGPEYAAFKTMLLTYVDLISADVARHAPAVAALLEEIEGRVDLLLATLDSMPGLASAAGQPTERSPGRSREDWADLTAWYTGRRGRSGPVQLRAAADQALGQLIANAKRMLAAAGTGVSRRADLLRLAVWFDEADAPTAHRLFDAAFGAYPARHLLGGPNEDSGRAGATTSWWDSDPVDIPLSLRERGDRIARGRASRVPDPGLDRERLLAEAQEELDRKRAAAAELAAAGDLDGARLTPAARELLLDRLSDLIAIDQALGGPATSTDTDANLVVTATPIAGRRTVIHCADGDLTVHDLELRADPASASTDYTGANASGHGADARPVREETTA
ncbi:TIGR02677 family protein [Nocardioides kribbensis]|uniref:TIGR02677 family protein n=1 Tax=Nocardioides kribbensis TaxID=305517 RepID=UPI0018791386|nr:TIGR02677 family protein [Nocardioides kribbensis]